MPPTKIYFDGGCRPNPGPMETAVVIRGQAYLRQDLPFGDNNDAEWLALIHALEMARSLGIRDAILLGDSALAVDQAKGVLPCRATRFREQLARFQALAEGFDRLRIRRIGRAQNFAGHALERVHGRL